MRLAAAIDGELFLTPHSVNLPSDGPADLLSKVPRLRGLRSSTTVSSCAIKDI